MGKNSKRKRKIKNDKGEIKKMKIKNELKNKKGITLIALVITILVAMLECFTRTLRMAMPATIMASARWWCCSILNVT